MGHFCWKWLDGRFGSVLSSILLNNLSDHSPAAGGAAVPTASASIENQC